MNLGAAIALKTKGFMMFVGEEKARKEPRKDRPSRGVLVGLRFALNNMHISNS